MTNTKLLTIVLLATTCTLSACSDKGSAARIESALTGVAPLVSDPIVTFEPPASDPAPPVIAEKPAPVAEVPVAEAPPPVVEPTPPAEPECVSIFRVQTCEDGVLHMLGPNGEWLN